MKTKYHKTAGGVVYGAGNRVLVLERDVERNGVSVHEVRLPKGHIDPGETPEQAALREVWEESGYGALEIVADLGEAHSSFDYRGKHHERNERYFLMRLTSEERGAPHPNPGSEEALFRPAWLSLTHAEDLLTYSTEREFARRARTLLQVSGEARSE